MNIIDEEEVNLKEILSIFLYNLKYIIILFVVSILFSIVFILVNKPVYRADAIIFFRKKNRHQLCLIKNLWIGIAVM